MIGNPGPYVTDRICTQRRRINSAVGEDWLDQLNLPDPDDNDEEETEFEASNHKEDDQDSDFDADGLSLDSSDF